MSKIFGMSLARELIARCVQRILDMDLRRLSLEWRLGSQ
jgi:hypothetical protein